MCPCSIRRCLRRRPNSPTLPLQFRDYWIRTDQYCCWNNTYIYFIGQKLFGGIANKSDTVLCPPDTFSFAAEPSCLQQKFVLKRIRSYSNHLVVTVVVVVSLDTVQVVLGFCSGKGLSGNQTRLTLTRRTSLGRFRELWCRICRRIWKCVERDLCSHDWSPRLE